MAATPSTSNATTASLPSREGRATLASPRSAVDGGVFGARSSCGDETEIASARRTTRREELTSPSLVRTESGVWHRRRGCTRSSVSMRTGAVTAYTSSRPAPVRMTSTRASRRPAPRLVLRGVVRQCSSDGPRETLRCGTRTAGSERRVLHGRLQRVRVSSAPSSSLLRLGTTTMIRVATRTYSGRPPHARYMEVAVYLPRQRAREQRGRTAPAWLRAALRRRYRLSTHHLSRW